MIICPKCNKKLRTGSKFCDNCGTLIAEDIAEKQPVELPVQKKKFSKKAVIIAVMAIIAVMTLVIILIFLFKEENSGSSSLNKSCIFYLKDKEIFFTDLKKEDKAYQLTSRLADGEDISNAGFAYSGQHFNRYTYLSKNGEYIFFPDKVSSNDVGVNLYYKEIEKPDEEAVKVDSDVRFYTVSEETGLVTYVKGEEGNLYQYEIDKDSKDKIDSGVRDFQISDDGKKIIYISEENNIYMKYADEEKEKVVSDVSFLVYITKDFTTVYYIKENALYKQGVNDDRTKIASDVRQVIKVYDTGEVYYVTEKIEKKALMEYVNDDMKDIDATITAPSDLEINVIAPERPDWRRYDTNEEYEAAYSEWEREYAQWENECARREMEEKKKQEAYKEKVKRDSKRAVLENETVELTEYSLRFFDGTDNTVLTDSLYHGYDYDIVYASDTPAIIYEAYNQSEPKKQKLSELTDEDFEYEIRRMVEEALYSSEENYIAVKATNAMVEQDSTACSFRINSSGTVVYYIDNITEGKQYGELYRLSIEDGVVGKAEVYDREVYADNCYFLNDTDFEYFKDYKEEKGDWYINQNRIDYDVEQFYRAAYPEFDMVLYFTDWDDETNCGTLKMYNEGKATKIADDVHSFSVTSDGRVLYLCDYSLVYFKGELHEWLNGKNRKIDDDVVYVLSDMDNRYRGK